jgi:DNA-binding NtrC family response regulator
MLLAQIFTDDIRAIRQGAPDGTWRADREQTARRADRAARSAVPVLVEGEPGGGAESLARAIHDTSERRQRPFVRFRPEDAAESEVALLKHLRDANGGTLFVHDVERLAPAAQDRLFDLLSGVETLPHGTRRAARLDVRIIAATDRPLAEQVRQARFREDLYYRLQVLPISLRPLRAQSEAVAEWAEVFMHRIAADEGKRMRGLSPEAASLLSRYDWPGNLRQLENVIFRAVLLAEGSWLTPAEFPQIAAYVQGFRIEIPPLPGPTALAPLRESAPVPRRDPHALPLVNESGEMRTLAELEAQAIRFALTHYQGHLSAISRRLGIGRSTLYRKLKELGLDDAAA